MAKKVLSIALALLMIVNVFAVAVSATVWTTEDAVITLKTDDTKPMPGDEVTVTVALQNNYNVHALQIMLAYDKEYYEVVDGSFTALLDEETGARFTGVAQSSLDAAAQEAMYAGLYSDAQKAQYGLVRIGYVWLASLAKPDAGETATPVFTNATDLASFKLKVKADAPTDGKGVIMVDPVFVVEEGVDTPAFDTRSATYVGKGAATISASATSGKLYGLPINVDGAKFAGCVHVAGEAVKENDVAADCVTAGSYDMVTYCTLCNEELSRETTTVEALGHTPAEAVEENRIEATATENGSYDMVVYCTVCGAEVSRESFVIEALGHTAGDEVIENEVAADCVNAGSYDKVVYCTCCEPKVELSRETVTVPALGHTEGEAVEENRIPATPTENGSYEMVVYCTVCGAEVSRESFVIEALGHYSGEPVEENRVEATCTEDGSYDKVVYCTCCTPAVELSRETVVIDALGHDYEAVVTAPDCVNGGYTTYTCSVCGDSYVADEVEALGHTEAEAVEENRTEADCVNAGSYDMVVYCSVCGEELSRETTVIEALGHTPAEAVEENRVEATMDENGSYDMVVYCSVCGEELSRESFVIPSLGSGPADYTELNALREEAAAIDRSAYSDESLAALDAVLAKITDDMKLPQQSIVDGWADELEAALAGLDRVVEKANAKVQIVLNKASAVKDDVITVTVKLTTNYYVTGVQLPILYDKTLFELVGNEGGMSYLTFDANSSFVNGRYDLNGNSGLTNGFKYTSNAGKWNTDEAKAQYDYAWITAAFNNNTNTSNPNTLAMPKDEVFVTFQVKALGDVEDTTEVIFISPDWTKTAEVKAGTFTMGYSDTEVNTKPLTYVTTGMNYNVETIAMEGVNYTGTVQSFATSTDNGDELTTIELIADGEVKYSTTVAGVGTQNFLIEGVEAGTYTVRVSKKDHATREYADVVVADEDIEEELKIHLKGDIDGNGRLMVTDYSAILRHVKKVATLEDYAFVCADVDGNGRIMVTDYSAVLRHVKKIALIW